MFHLLSSKKFICATFGILFFSGCLENQVEVGKPDPTVAHTASVSANAPVTSSSPVVTATATATPRPSTSPSPTGTPQSLSWISMSSAWKYNDKGSDLGSSWTAASYNDSAWASANAQFGYGNNGETTKVSYGPSSSSKYITTYFRRTFTVSNPSGVTSIDMKLIYNDGAVVYINGNEVRRANLPAGAMSFSTLATNQVSVVTEAITVNPNVLVSGTNTIAVEVHQYSAGSSSLAFDLSLSGKSTSIASSSSTYFAQDFQNTSLVLGSGGMYYSLKGWNIGSLSNVSSFYLTADGSDVIQQITSDPAGTGRSVLYAQSVHDDPNNSVMRAQTELDMKPATDLSVYHTSHRIYLSPDLADLSQFSELISAKGTSHWFTLYEIWNGVNSSWDGDVGGSARWDLSLRKEAGVGQALIWEFTAEKMQPAANSYDLLWPLQINASVPVPLGKWVTIDYYLKRGEGSAGEVKVTLTPDGGSSVVLFDVIDSTIYPGHPELHLRCLQPFKLYTSPTIMDWMYGRSKNAGAFYNDFKWFTD